MVEFGSTASLSESTSLDCTPLNESAQRPPPTPPLTDDEESEQAKEDFKQLILREPALPSTNKIITPDAAWDRGEDYGIFDCTRPGLYYHKPALCIEPVVTSNVNESARHAPEISDDSGDKATTGSSSKNTSLPRPFSVPPNPQRADLQSSDLESIAFLLRADSPRIRTKNMAASRSKSDDEVDYGNYEADSSVYQDFGAEAANFQATNDQAEAVPASQGESVTAARNVNLPQLTGFMTRSSSVPLIGGVPPFITEEITPPGPIPTIYDTSSFSSRHSTTARTLNPVQSGQAYRNMNSSNWRSGAGPHNSMPASASHLLYPQSPHNQSAYRASTARFPASRTKWNRYTGPKGKIICDKWINYRGYIPSSLQNLNALGLRAQVNSKAISTEQARAARNMPSIIFDEAELDPSRLYAKYNGGYVEVTDDLFARSICPADLLQYPCRWDELGGCNMMRLCTQLSKYTDHVCQDDDNRYAFGANPEPNLCPYLHWEIEPSCRFAVSRRDCEIVLKKEFDCAVGHDFTWGRQVSRRRFEHHVRGALLAGANAGEASHTIILPCSRHLSVAKGPGYLPEYLFPEPKPEFPEI